MTPVFGRNYKRYLVHTLVHELVTPELEESLVEHFNSARSSRGGIFIPACGMLQQRYTDRIDTAMVTGFDEASGVGGKIVPVLDEVGRVKPELRIGQGELGIESLSTGDECVWFEAESEACFIFQRRLPIK